MALVALGKFADAEIALQSLRLQNPDDPDVALALALLDIYRASYEEALPLLGEALRKKPNVARIHILLALVLAKLHRTDEAEQFYQGAQEINPDDERLSRVQAAILIETGKFEEALQILASYSLDHPDDSWDVWNDLGTLYYVAEQFDRAEESFKRAIESAGEMGLTIPFVHFNLALCNNAQGRYEDAKEQLSITLEADAELAPAWSALGLLVAADGDIERAEEFIQKAIELQPEEPSHWYAMGQVMELAGDQESASHYMREGYRAAQRLQPTGEVPEE